MMNAIIKGIFTLITGFFNGLLSPIIFAVTSLFPSTTNFISSILTFLSYSFTYVRSILSLLCIDDYIIIAFFDYLVVCYSIYTIVLVIKFGITIYDKFKI